jgi:hypothetical protein
MKMTAHFPTLVALLYNRTMGEMTFNFPPALQRWIEAQVAEGRYADAADYIRDLVRRDMKGGMPCK